MRVGITGTRDGMTLRQLVTLERMLEEMGPPKELHHGDCVGVDAEAHETAETLEIKNIVIHPPDVSTHRAFCRSEFVRPERPYLTRNREMVREIDVLIVIPKGDKETRRSGTWATVRYARKRGVDVRIIFPDGSVEVSE